MKMPVLTSQIGDSMPGQNADVLRRGFSGPTPADPRGLDLSESPFWVNTSKGELNTTALFMY